MSRHPPLLDLAGALVVLSAVLAIAIPRAVASAADTPGTRYESSAWPDHQPAARASSSSADTTVPTLVRALFGEHTRAALCVAGAESGWDPHAVNENTDGSRDRGLFQINSRWHPAVSDAEAFDPVANARYAHALSDGGRDWTAWAMKTRLRCALV